MTEKVLGPGTGIAYVQGPKVKCASRGGVTVLFCGQLEPPKKVTPNESSSEEKNVSSEPLSVRKKGNRGPAGCAHRVRPTSCNQECC